MACVSSTTAAPSAPQVNVNRPNSVSVGTIVWLSSELMFFAGLFAMYFTHRSVSADIWPEHYDMLNIPWALTITLVLVRSEEHTSELQSRGHLVCRLLLEKKKKHISKPGKYRN